ncbi:MAG: PAS domain-containing protein, partial [Candidatus Omnitrophota bacterium]
MEDQEKTKEALLQEIHSLRESEMRFRALAENIQEVLWMSDPEISKIFYINPAFEKLWGIPCEDLYQNPKSYLDFVLPEDKETVLREIEAHRQGRYNVEYRIRRPDGSIRWV